MVILFLRLRFDYQRVSVSFFTVLYWQRAVRLPHEETLIIHSLIIFVFNRHCGHRAKERRGYQQ